MCGIAGIYNFRTEEPVDPETIHKMCERLIHRGPDDYGVYIENAVGLGHRRLSIIDLSSKAKQPMCNEDGTVWITFNGEIYNFREIRDDLIKKGHRFKTKADTEVIIHAYEEYGIHCLNKFVGMFAFAIWDKNKRMFFLARDRVGKKPLVYYLSDKFFIFASEIKSILEDPRVPREVNVQAMDYYFTFGFVPSPETMFKGIQKLPPGHFLIFREGKLQIERYWGPHTNLDADFSGFKDEEEVEARIESLLEDSVRLRMVSDVPVGAFLSGGIDSSLVVALMSKVSDEPVRTFTIGFEEKAFDETPFARIVANRFKTQHKEMILTPNAIEVLPKLIWHYNEPFGDSSAIPTYYLSQMTSAYVKVALSGDGGDELFGGYNNYVTLSKLRYYDYVPESLRSLIRKLINEPIENYWGTYDYLGTIERIKKAINIRMLSTEERSFYLLSLNNFEFRRNLFSEDINNELRKCLSSKEYYHQMLSSIHCKDKINKILSMDVHLYLPDDLLVKVDIASMAHSLEVRCPLLDHRLIEVVSRLPARFKIRSGRTKVILKKIGQRLLPSEIIKRPKKGFSVPLDIWFRTALKRVMNDVILSSDVDNLFNTSYLKKIVMNHQNNIANHGRNIWLVLNFLLWYRMFIKKETISFV